MLKDGIAPIETWYNGRLYRSRTEARWAIFLETLCQPFVYEAEGFELQPIPLEAEPEYESIFADDLPLFYLPDFKLPQVHQWIEVKPLGQPEIIEIEKIKRLAYWREEAVYILCGTPDEYEILPANSIECEVDWCQCRYCGAVGMSTQGWSTNLRCCEMNMGKERNGSGDFVKGAIQAALKYRFDWRNSRP